MSLKSLRSLGLNGVAAAVLLSASSLSLAAQSTTTFAVTATVNANCIINSAGAMAFGAYTPGTGNVDQTSQIVVRCSNGTAYGLGLDAGTGAGSTLGQRTMSSATAVGSVVNYNLYTDAGRATVWQNPTTAGAAAGNQSGVGTGLGNIAANQKTHTVYGRLADDATSQAAAPATDYTSTVTVTINY